MPSVVGKTLDESIQGRSWDIKGRSWDIKADMLEQTRSPPHGQGEMDKSVEINVRPRLSPAHLAGRI